MFKPKTQDDDVNITKEQFEKLKAEALIIDVREPEEYQVLQKIPHSINVPYLTLIANPQQFIKDQAMIIVTICNAGHRSTAAAVSLREQGYLKAYVLNHGIYGYYRKH